MLQKPGKTRSKSLALKLLLISATLTLGGAACPPRPGDSSSTPPPMPVCIGDGKGGAQCVDATDKTFYADPASLNNWWMTSPESMAAFTAWCYGAKVDQVKSEMQKIEVKAKGDAAQ